MHHLSWSSSRDEVVDALAALSPSKGLIVGPGWVDIGTLGELERQVRRGRTTSLVAGIYMSLQGDREVMRQTVGLLAAIDAARFAAADQAFRERNPASPVGHCVPRRAKHTKLVAHGWGHSSQGPMGCAQVRGLDRTVTACRDFAFSQQPVR